MIYKDEKVDDVIERIAAMDELIKKLQLVESQMKWHSCRVLLEGDNAMPP